MGTDIACPPVIPRQQGQGQDHPQDSESHRWAVGGVCCALSPDVYLPAGDNPCVCGDLCIPVTDSKSKERVGEGTCQG